MKKSIVKLINFNLTNWSLRKKCESLLLFFFTSCLLFAIYSNTLQYPFIFDDSINIVDNNAIHLKSFTYNNIKRIFTDSYLANRPTSNITFALNYYFNQEQVVGYHIINIFIHLINGFLLYLFVKLTLELPLLRSRHSVLTSHWLAFATALIWVVHPIHTQSTTYIVQRMNSLAALFYLLTFICYIKGRLAQQTRTKWILFSCSIISFLLSLGSKEMVAVLPFLILIYDLYFFKDLDRHHFKRYALIVCALAISTFFIALIFMGTSPIESIMGGYEIRDFNLHQRVLTEFRVVFFYLFLLFFPHPSQLNFDHNFVFSNSILDPLTTLLSLLGIVLLIAVAFWKARQERLISFCILWYFINLIVESSVIGLELVFEHRTYIPSMAVVLLTVLIVHRVIKSTSLRLVLLCVVIVLLSLWTYERNKVWKDRVTLWEDCVKKSPLKTRTLNGLGVAHYSEGNYNEAIRWHRKALDLNYNVPNSHFYLANALRSKWQLEEAAFHYSMAVRLLPSHNRARHHLAGVKRMIESKKARKNKKSSQ